MSKYLSEKEKEDHHKGKNREEEITIQTPSKIEQGRFEDVGIQEFDTCKKYVVKDKEIGVSQELNPSHIKFLIPTESSSKPVKVYSRIKTRPVKTLRLNMKVVLNPKIKRNQVIEVQESLDDEEDERENFVGSTLNKVLDNIEQNLKRVPDLVPNNCPNHFDDEENLQENTTSIILDLKGKDVAEFEPGEPSK